MISVSLPEIVTALALGLALGLLVNIAADWLPARRTACAGAGCGNQTSLLQFGRRYTRIDGLANRRFIVTTLVMSGLALLAWVRFEPWYLRFISSGYAAILLLVTIIDFEHRLVLNVVLVPTALAALLVGILVPGLSLASAATGGLVGLGIFLVIAAIGRGAMGAGDVKLAGVIGLITGFPLVASALSWGIVLGGAGTAFLILSRRATLRSRIPYAPWLASGALLVIFLRY